MLVCDLSLCSGFKSGCSASEGLKSSPSDPLMNSCVLLSADSLKSRQQCQPNPAKDYLRTPHRQLYSPSSGDTFVSSHLWSRRFVSFFFCTFAPHGARVLLRFAPGLLVHPLRQRSHQHHGVEVSRSRVLPNLDNAERRRTETLKGLI